MCFGTDPGITSRIQWYWASDTAIDLGLVTPFHSRVEDMHTVYGDLGEVNWEKRAWRDGTFPINVPGNGPYCGSREMWLHGFPGGSPVGLPRNMFGLAECCGGLQAFPGDPTIGLQPQVWPMVLPGVKPLKSVDLEEVVARIAMVIDFPSPGPLQFLPLRFLSAESLTEEASREATAKLQADIETIFGRSGSQSHEETEEAKEPTKTGTVFPASADIDVVPLALGKVHPVPEEIQSGPQKAIVPDDTLPITETAKPVTVEISDIRYLQRKSCAADELMAMFQKLQPFNLEVEEKPKTPSNKFIDAASHGTETFNVAGSTTWTAPSGVTSVQAECWGGGGGGSNGTIGPGPGSSGGHYTVNASVAVTPGNTYNVVVGAGGIHSTLVTPGGNSTFTGDAVTVTGHGGNVGGLNTFTAGAGGSAGTTGGGGGGSSAGNASNGNAGANGTTLGTGLGGAAPAGGGKGGNGSNTTAPAQNGSAPSGGGGGGSGQAGSHGGDGATGQVILTW